MLYACLYTIFFVFCYTSWRFYAFFGTNLLMRYHSASFFFWKESGEGDPHSEFFLINNKNPNSHPWRFEPGCLGCTSTPTASWTNLLMRYHSASSLFYAIFVFKKSYIGNILRIGRNKIRSSYLPDTRRSPKQRRWGPRGQAHPRAARPSPWLRYLGVWPPGPLPDAAPPPIYSPRWENPRGWSLFPETYREPPSSMTRDREGPEALPGTLPERGITTGGLLHHHACLHSDLWVVYLVYITHFA
jgi:hypothetical protein